MANKNFNAADWAVASAGKEIEGAKGLLHVMCENPGAFYITQEGVEAFAGVGVEIRRRIKGPYTVRIETQGNAWVFKPVTMVPPKRDGVFTSTDRMPMESGTMQAVRSALLIFKEQQREIWRAAARKKEPPRAKSDTPAKEPEPVVEPVEATPAE